MRRLVYAPQVFAYIQTETGVINVSDDIVGGSIERRLDATSTATLRIQNRRKYYTGRILPMDRIIIFLKKTRPILVFSGYLDTAPFLSIVPGVVEITASCTLKLLEHTYWDPALPYVQNLIMRTLGIFPTPGRIQPVPSTVEQTASQYPKDIGFGNMLHFLVNRVAGWDKKKVHILPMPPKWSDTMVKLFEESEEDSKDLREAAKKALGALVSVGGATGASAGSQVGQITDYPGDSATKAEIANWMGTKAQQAGLPPELPVMAALVESGLRPGLTEEESDADSAGFFQMRMSIWNKPPYTGYRENPALQLQWFIDHAIAVRDKNADNKRRYTTSNRANFGEWCADTERPAERYRYKYQTKLDEATQLLSSPVRSQANPTLNSRERGPIPLLSQVNGAGAGMQPNGEYSGTKGPIFYIYNSAVAGRESQYRITSQKRCNTCEGGNAASGANSDHHDANLDAYALDIDFGSSSPTPAGDYLASAIVQIISTASGEPVANWGRTGGDFKATVNGIRYQVLYRTNIGGDHYNHIHIGAKNTGGATGVIQSGYDQTVTGQPSTVTVQGQEFFNPLGAFNYTGPDTYLQGTHSPSAAPHNWQSDAANDMFAPNGTPVYAAVTGRVSRVSREKENVHSGTIFGGSVTIEGQNVRVFNTHITNITVNEGDQVTAGQQIAQVTRWDTNPSSEHLHFAMNRIGSDDAQGINPRPYLEATKGKSTPSTVSIGTDGSASANEGGVSPVAAAFNVMFNFPADQTESIFLTGARALENDVKLIDSIREIAQSCLRVFASHPNGDFMAWYPDYFNVSGRNPALKISENELIDCTIYLSDTNLATHVYVHGNVSAAEDGNTALMMDRIFGRGVVTIDQAYMLDSFLSKPQEFITSFDEILDADRRNKDKPANKKLSKRERQLLADQEGALAFLKRYGARPFVVDNPTIRHPMLEFFMAYQWFQRKWAEQFQSNVSFTFMPELFPGTIVKLPNHVNFFVESVTHNFDNQGGYRTSASLIAPSTDRGYNFGMALASPAFKSGTDDDGPARRIRDQGSLLANRRPPPRTLGGTQGPGRL